MQEHTSARAAQILRDKGYKARALLGGFAAWAQSGGETEPITEAATGVPTQDVNANSQRQQGGQVIASPNPTIDDSKTPAKEIPKGVEVRPIQPAQSATAAPMKSVTKAKPKKRRHKGKN